MKKKFKLRETVVEKARKFLDDLIAKDSKMMFYIKPGWQDPTVFVVLVKMFEQDALIGRYIFEDFTSVNDIVEVAKALQETAKAPTSFVLSSVDSSLKEYLQDAGINNVVFATKADYEAVLKAAGVQRES